MNFHSFSGQPEPSWGIKRVGVRIGCGRVENGNWLSPDQLWRCRTHKANGVRVGGRQTVEHTAEKLRQSFLSSVLESFPVFIAPFSLSCSRSLSLIEGYNSCRYSNLCCVFSNHCNRLHCFLIVSNCCGGPRWTTAQVKPATAAKLSASSWTNWKFPSISGFFFCVERRICSNSSDFHKVLRVK